MNYPPTYSERRQAVIEQCETALEAAEIQREKAFANHAEIHYAEREAARALQDSERLVREAEAMLEHQRGRGVNVPAPTARGRA